MFWQRPEEGRVTLNVDGSWKSRFENTGGGGVLRDHNGEWLHGFMHKSTMDSADAAESQALIKGLEIVWTKGYKRFHVQTDSEKTVKWVQGMESPPENVKSILEPCKNWMRKDWEVAIGHIYREKNNVADMLAKLATHIDTITAEMEFLLRVVMSEVVEDRMRAARPRHILIRH